MSLEYDVKAIGISDSADGGKMLVCATVCNRTVKLFLSRQQGEFVIKELNPVQEPCA